MYIYIYIRICICIGTLEVGTPPLQQVGDPLMYIYIYTHMYRDIIHENRSHSKKMPSKLKAILQDSALNNYYASVSPLIHFLPHTAFVKILNQVANIAIVFPSSCHKIQPTKLKFRYSCCSCSCNSSCSRNGSCSCGLICCSVSIHQTLLLLVLPSLACRRCAPPLCLKAPHLSS